MNHTGKLFKVVLQGGFTLLILFSPISFTAALADQVTDVYGVSAPEDAWAYFKFPNAGHGFDTTYVPTRSDVLNSQFLGFVVTPAVKVQRLDCCCINTSLGVYGTSEGIGRFA